MARQPPKRHVVRGYNREGHTVHSYARGVFKPQHQKPLTTSHLEAPGLRKIYRGSLNGFKIYGVNGSYVRDKIDISFTMGNHCYAGDGYIPKGEVWIDDDLAPFDFEALKIHETVEAKRMRDLKEPYEVAHFHANEEELKWRNKFKSRFTTKRHYNSKMAREIGRMVGIEWTKSPFTAETFAQGMNVENEHGIQDPQTDVTHNDPVLTAKIAWAHLKEKPDYYELLKKVED